MLQQKRFSDRHIEVRRKVVEEPVYVHSPEVTLECGHRKDIFSFSESRLGTYLQCHICEELQNKCLNS